MNQMNSARHLWMAFIMISLSLLSSCGDKRFSLKTRILAGEELDNGVEILTGDDFCLESMTRSPLLTELCDAYHAFVILNSVRTDMELYDRFDYEEAIEALENMKAIHIVNDSIRNMANEYISKTYTNRNDTTGIVSDEYNSFKDALIRRYHVERYGDLSEETYWNEYDENKRIEDFDSIQSLRIENADKAKDLLEPLLNNKTDFDKQCIYLKEYARAFYENEAHNEIFDSLLLRLENQMNQGKYSIYLMEIWRLWRVHFQDGHSKDSPIYNKVYNELRLVCCRTILNYIMQHPDDMMAINQFLVLASIDNINRYGEYPYGNQIVMEEFSLFPEYHAEYE